MVGFDYRTSRQQDKAIQHHKHSIDYHPPGPTGSQSPPLPPSSSSFSSVSSFYSTLILCIFSYSFSRSAFSYNSSASATLPLSPSHAVCSTPSTSSLERNLTCISGSWSSGYSMRRPRSLSQVMILVMGSLILASLRLAALAASAASPSCVVGSMALTFSTAFSSCALPVVAFSAFSVSSPVHFESPMRNHQR